MDPVAMDPLVVRHDDSDWMALEPLLDEDFLRWHGWNHNDAAASQTPLPTPLASQPWQPAPVLLPVEDYVDQFEWTPAPAPAAAHPSYDAASKGEKRLRPKQLTAALRFWLERRLSKPYATLEEKKLAAEALNLSVAQVTNFCNNYRKRYAKVGDKLTSYRELVSAAQ
jgi:hypothetical protein